MTKTAKDNLKDHLWPYSDEDIAIIREEKTQLVTATEFAEVHMEKLCLEKKLATAVEALGDLVSAQEQLWTSINGRGLVDKAMDHAKQALAEIGGEDE